MAFLKQSNSTTNLFNLFCSNIYIYFDDVKMLSNLVKINEFKLLVNTTSIRSLSSAVATIVVTTATTNIANRIYCRNNNNNNTYKINSNNNRYISGDPRNNNTSTTQCYTSTSHTTTITHQSNRINDHNTIDNRIKSYSQTNYCYNRHTTITTTNNNYDNNNSGNRINELFNSNKNKFINNSNRHQLYKHQNILNTSSSTTYLFNNNNNNSNNNNYRNSNNNKFAPVTGRARFIGVSLEEERDLSDLGYNYVMESYEELFLPENNVLQNQVRMIAKKLVPHSGIDLPWECHVINSPEINAFVLPSGKIFIFTGLFKVVKTEDELAAVISHEIGHAIARHSAERMSLLKVGIVFLTITRGLIGDTISGNISTMISTKLLELNYSRMQEIEADIIGVGILKKAGFNVNAAVHVQEKFGMIDDDQDDGLMALLSTHPKSAERVTKIQEWIEADRLKELEQPAPGLVQSNNNNNNKEEKLLSSKV
ncbi:hypothetical protein PPL_03706 [Heterostelium album PN500]|uniref:Peptidase M48 domain-containing protein n=1 Tax=Heterostelium pallidum (strain ATCC 26659 / Pp 5 / PN500) TaxID=670386 RepID=D3B6F8_HETP5|nr:hypothetical protein PPL_03706 [Heterostelium album PN500]EFA82928.1 hypothetical protein PPL_03706 [Heterostelium album PN500]|eukprot:XP_020435045.1 hypothetical protein PPL_03706 [Heterostelium album PN500]